MRLTAPGHFLFLSIEFAVMKQLSLNFSISQHMAPRIFIKVLYVLIGLLLAVNLFVVYGEAIMDRQYSFAWRFYFDRRLNFPFFFSLALQLINLYLLFSINTRANLGKGKSIFWKTLFITFFLFALDEAFYVHQHFKMSTFGVIASYDRASWSHYLWVIPYFIVFGTLIMLLFLYSRDLASELRNKLLMAGFVFLFGAVALEFAGTYYAVIRPHADIYLLLIKSGESTLQMTGSVMFIDAFYRTRQEM
jgi:hypothetical protein